MTAHDIALRPLHPSRPRIVLIGGGNGSSMLLKGLKHYNVSLTAVIATTDSGGSSGRLRKELNLPALGDLRRCLVALAGDDARSQGLARLFEFRFRKGKSLAGHTFGNILLAGLLNVSGGLDDSIQEAQKLLRSRGTVLPVTLAITELCATLNDGTILRGEATINNNCNLGERWIQQIFLDPQVTANPKAIRAIRKADVIVLGPGDLYTSLLPNLLIEGISEAISSSSAKIIFVGNIAENPNETKGYKLSNFLEEVLRYLEFQEPFHTVILDSQEGNLPVHTTRVQSNLAACSELALNVFVRPLTRQEFPELHDSQKTSAAIVEAIS